VTAPATRVAIALGSNLENRFELLRSARRALAGISESQLLAASQLEDTVAVGMPQPGFLNQMVLLSTTLSLAALQSELHAIERQHGRVRDMLKGPRTLDLDIVWADGLVITSSALLVPHPGLCERAFWQRGIAEVLGVDVASDAIVSAQVHAGMDTAGSAHARHEHRWSGSWETADGR
jgi:2-amino-4-hydroxy-6-hydroxymethyldihydropteridine diphosphokinase